MAQFHDFEEIIAWQEARKLTQAIRQICKKENVRRDYAFTDQITRAVRSISANIAEGNDAMTIPAFIEFLGYAKRSCAEVRSHLYDALDEQYASPEEVKRHMDHTKMICRMIAKLIHHLQTLDPKLKRTFSVHSNKPIN